MGLLYQAATRHEIWGLARPRMHYILKYVPDGLQLHLKYVLLLVSSHIKYAPYSKGTQELHPSSGIEEDEQEEEFYLLMPVFQDRSETRQQILDGGCHLGHTNDVHDGLEGTQDGAQHFGVLLSQVLVQDNTQVAQQLFLIASLHDTAEHEWHAAQESQRGYITGHQ